MKKSLVILLVFLALRTVGQDIHFSEFYATPLLTNPALTGHFQGTYRLNGIVRNQWSSVSAQPFQTFGGSFDINSPFKLKNTGLGIQASHDITGLSALTTTQLNLALSKSFHFGESGLALHLGFMGGMWQQYMDPTKLSYDDQFDGVRYDPSIPTQQVFPGSAPLLTYNLHAGAFLEQRFSERSRWGVGFSSFNLTEPSKGRVDASEFTLKRRYNAHLLTSIPLGGIFDLMPAAQLQMQGEQQAILVGTALRLHLSTSAMNPRSLQIGLWGRYKDAAIINAGIQLKDLYLGGSYDVNFSRLQPASNYRGGWEACLIYVIPTVRENVKRLRQCPDYL